MPFSTGERRALAVILTLSLLTLGGTIDLASKARWRGPPFSYTRESYEASPNVACPGDTIAHPFGLVVREVPELVLVARTIWDVAARRTVVPDVELEYVVWLERGLLSGTRSFLVPKLLPGRYELRVAAADFTSRVGTYRVAFRVPEGCN
jgi:hypothetical protein